MGIKEFRLEFNQPIRSFFASQTIRGKVILDLRQAKKIKGLEVQFHGKGKVYWKESVSSSFNSSTSTTTGTTNSRSNSTSIGGSNKKKYSADGLLTTITSNVQIPIPLLRRGSSQHDKKQRDYNTPNPTTVPSTVLGSNTSQTIMSVEETYLDERIVLLEKKDCDNIVLESGRHEYQFEFKIPSNCPSSFQGPYGDIKYYAEALLTRPRRKQAHRTKVLFTVNGLLDLNKDPVSTITSVASSTGTPTGTVTQSPSPPIYNCEIKQFTKSNTNLLACLFCLTSPAGRQGQGKNPNNSSNLTTTSPGKKSKVKKNGGVGFHFKLHKSFFVPGEYIQFVAEMRNMSNVDVSGVTLSLIQETNYFVEDRVKSGLKQTMATAKGPSINSGQVEIWETNPNDSLFLQIPSLPPTNLATSRIIEVKYYLQLEMEFYGQKNIKGQVPILIGTIPLRSTFKDFMTIKKKNEEEQSDDEIITEYYKTGCKTSKSFGETLGYPDLATPNFEEAACFTPCLDFSTIGIGGILPNGISNNKKKSAANGTENDEPDGNKEENEENDDDDDSSTRTDSDEEYLIEVNEKGNNDDKFVPLYAKYVTVYGYDD